MSVYSLLVVPRQQLINPVDLVVGNTNEDIRQLSLRIQVVELCGFHEGVNDGSGLATAFRANEHVIFTAHGVGQR